MYQIYQVKPYDTLQSIANDFNTTVEDLKKINGFVDYSVLSTSIIVPKNKNRFDTYIVKKGDSLYSISKRYSTTPNTLALINGIDLDEYIYPGEELLVPNGNDQVYVISENETLQDVLNKINVSEQELANMNRNLFLMPDQVIFYKRDNNKM